MVRLGRAVRSASVALALVASGCSRGKEQRPDAAPPPVVLPASTELARELCAALLEERQLDEAERCLKELLARPDSTPADAAQLGVLFFDRFVLREDKDQETDRYKVWAKEARRWCEEALARDDSIAAAHYVLGVLGKEYVLDVDPSFAVEHLRRAVALAPADLGARFHLAVALDELRTPESRDEAIALYDRLVDLGVEFSGVYFGPSMYRMQQQLQRRNRGDDRERAAVLRARHGELPQPASPQQEDQDQKLGQLGRGRRPAAPPPAVPQPAAPARVTWAPPTRVLPSAGVARAIDVADLDADRREDLVVAGERGLWVALQRAGSEGDGVAFDVKRVAETSFAGVVAAELEGDDAASLVAWGPEGPRLFTPDGKGGFADDSSRLPPLAAAAHGVVPVDYDHDGNLDLIVLAEASFRMWRSRGVPRGEDSRRLKLGPIGFDDVTAEREIAGCSGSWLALEDFDSDHDVDLLLGGADAPTLLLSNLRCEKFEALGSARTRLPDRLAHAPWLGDFDHDSIPDALLPGAPTRLWKGRGDLSFEASTVPPPLERAEDLGATLADADLDGGEEWLDAPIAVDLDLDGALDLVAPAGSGEPGVHWSRGRLESPPRRHLLVLRGRKDNRFAVGAVVETRCGARYQRRFVRRPTQLFGFSGAEPPLLRITWPDGVVQYPEQCIEREDVEFARAFASPPGSVVDPPPDPDPQWSEHHPRLPLDPGSDFRVLVLQKKGPPGSCPFLYSWDGARYVFVTDVLGTTPLGLPLPFPGERRYVQPDHDELVRLVPAQLAPVDGEYRFQLTEELRETTYLDRAQLWVVDHEAGVEVHPEERFCFPPFPPQRLHSMRRIEPLARATDQEGRDWTRELAAQDEEPAVPFAPLAETWRGLATPHSLELELPEGARTAKRVRLLMTGWLQWGDASVNMAIAHHGDPRLQFLPPLLSAPEGDGSGDPAETRWRDLGPPVGFPAGKTKTMVLDVTSSLDRADPRLRVTSTLELYWDEIRVALDDDDGQSDAPIAVTKLEPKTAKLWFRGFSRPSARRPEQPQRFDWDRVETAARFDQHRGMLTRYGDVLPLLGSVDDRFVLLSSGDAIDLRFDASAIAPPRPGMARTFLLFLDGWAKDADPNTTHAQTVEPLPFHAMSGYPYADSERFPDDAAHDAWRREWNTRPGRRLIPDLADPALRVDRW
jgi:hypothetical protein